MHAKQAEIDASPARFKIVRAGRKFGKTTYAQKKALDWMRKPNAIHFHIAPTYKLAKLISWVEFKNLIPLEALGKKPNDTDLIITLKNGSRLFLLGSDEPDSLRGLAPSSFTFEEAAYHKPEVWESIMRPNIIPQKAPGLFISTPRGFNWFKDLEDEAQKLIRQGDKEWSIFHYSIYDNPHLPKDEIEKAKRSCESEQVWRQEYLAEYESSVGRVFGCLSDDRHFRPILIPRGTFDCWRGVDWGMRDDTACVWGFVRNKTIFIYREYAANNLSAPAQAKIIREQTTPQEKVSMTAISHDASKEDPAMKGLTVLWHFREGGLTPIRPSSRDKKHSRAMIQQLLQENRLVIDPDKCPKLRKQMLSYEWKDTAMEKPFDMGNDDLVDALHYLVELLQFDLFMGVSLNKEKSFAEIMAAIAQEKLEQQRANKLTIPSIFRMKDDGLDVENSPAGYI